MRSESATEVPNYYLATLSDDVENAEGESAGGLAKRPITHFGDPTPELRQIEKRIVRYEREDGVPLSFELNLPPGYEKGTRLPTVVYAYPLEYSSAATAGQVRGSTQRFDRFRGASHLFFLLRGYAVLDNTAMPMIGDPETTYDTFVPQLVADAKAAVATAVDLGVADPDRIGVIGHSHGGLMVANLLAHTDLFKAGMREVAPITRRCSRSVSNRSDARYSKRATSNPVVSNVLRRPDRRAGADHSRCRRLESRDDDDSVRGLVRGSARIGWDGKNGAPAVRGSRLSRSREYRARVVGATAMVRRVRERGKVENEKP